MKLFLSLLVFLTAGSAWAQSVAIRFEDSPQAAYAARKLEAALQERGYTVARDKPEYVIRLDRAPKKLPAEAFTVTRQGKQVTVVASDARGLIDGALALAEQVRNGTRLERVSSMQDAPALAFRGIKFNLPWDTYRASSSLDQHYATARDLKFWEAFLDMLVENRFNAVSLWNLHPFTYMIQPKNFPEASRWSPQEFAEWQQLYRGIFRMAKERGLDTYIVFWSIFVSEELAKAHGVAQENFYPHYFVKGDTSPIVRRYLKESVTQVLNEYPDLDGIGISHGEGMAGMTPLERQKWMDEVLLPGALAADRPVKLIHRVPFSSGLSSEPGVSKNVEVITRAAMEQLEDKFEGPIWVEMKFNWSHAHSTPKLVKVHGGPLGDTYFNPTPKNYKVVWQARNEDFFALRWGVPDFIRQHVALNGKADYVGGYFVGSETYIPALDYFTASKEPVQWKYAFERQWLFYKLWGRLLYNAATPDAVFEAEFVRRYGPQAQGLLQAYALSSATQLRLASLYDSTWDFTLYSEGFLALQGDDTKYISVDRLIQQPTMDPAYVSVSEFVRNPDNISAERLTPLELAQALEGDNQKALALVTNIDTRTDVSLRHEVADVSTWAHLGLHLAEKLRGAVALERYRTSGDSTQKEQAITHLQRALKHWDEVVRITRPLYRDMPLTHYNGSAYTPNPNNLFHWALVRDEVARDVEIARTSEAKR